MIIENELFPENGVLITNGEEATAIIVDIELDPIECVFNNDKCVELDVSGYEYITLSIGNLKTLKRLIEQAESYYKEYFKNEIE
jgi:hypothetical protein